MSGGIFIAYFKPSGGSYWRSSAIIAVNAFSELRYVEGVFLGSSSTSSISYIDVAYVSDTSINVTCSVSGLLEMYRIVTSL